MKKFYIFMVAVLLILVVGIFFIRRQVKDTDITAEQTKVGLILNGTKSDHSWSQSHYEGMEACAKKLNLSVDYRELVLQNEQCLSIIDEFVKNGCKIIFANSYGHGEAVMQAAEKYPDICFFHATGTQNRKNLATYFGRIYQMRYLSGIVAGLKTKSNTIGYAAAFDLSEVNRGLNAFTLGVRSVNPDAVVYVRFINAWDDDKMTKDAAERLFEHYPDMDVLAMHTDSLAALEAADKKGIWSIGYNIDNSALYPDSFLTAPVWTWENFYQSCILECLKGKFKGKNYWEGIDSGMMGLAKLTKNVEADIAGYVDAAEKKLRNGSFDVFYGPIYDNTGTLRIEEGENMTDEAMLENFDWFVEGVAIDETE